MFVFRYNNHKLYFNNNLFFVLYYREKRSLLLKYGHVKAHKRGRAKPNLLPMKLLITILLVILSIH